MIQMAEKPISLNDAIQQARSDDAGIPCPKCGCRHWYVRRTHRRDGEVVRYKSCRNCDHHLTTYERTAGGWR